MTSLAYTVADSATMLRRNLKHQLRYPSLTLMLAGMPIVFLLLFVYIFGGQLGFRSHANALEWLAVAGMLALFAFALIWLSAALGLAAKSVETASNTPMFLTLLPFLSSAFVATATMPAGLRQFAEYEPFTPVTQTVRGLLTGGPIGTNAIAAIAWSAGIALASYLWAVRLYNRRRAATPS